MRGGDYLSKATCLTRPHLFCCVSRRVKDRRNTLNRSPEESMCWTSVARQVTPHEPHSFFISRNQSEVVVVIDQRRIRSVRPISVLRFSISDGLTQAES